MLRVAGSAYRRRDRPSGLPSTVTNEYRVVNSEGDRYDGLSRLNLILTIVLGLIIDGFGDIAVIASSAAWLEKYKEHIKKCISEIDMIKSIVWRPSTDISKEEGLDLGDLVQEELSGSTEKVKVKEYETL
uniref:uncharacterized protein LOC122607171 n=1 Tax=Erigeron canadensis TaxID=72917 RepID=UPI001CB97935|nr:uncharacterized protein LOC122607171 [Erigeron canadensis]